MQINFGSYSSIAGAYPAWSTPASASGVSTSASVIDNAAQTRFVNTHVLDLVDAFEMIRESWRNSHTAYEREAATASSGSALDLGAATRAVLRSSEEVNATPTSFSTAGPSWNQSSSSPVTIDGEYDGSNGSGGITLEVIRGGTVGRDYTRVGVWGPAGEKIEDIVLDGDDPAGTPYTLSNGLVVSFGEGQLTRGDTLDFEVSDSVGTVVDPNASFDGRRGSDAMLQYGLDVTAGSFRINNVTIAVDAFDSINSVLWKINESEAGVTAEFDAESESIVLRQETPGAGADLAVGDDSSGFLAAMKLDPDAVEAGLDAPDIDRVMSDVAAFAGVSSGNLLINGVTVAFDKTVDSLRDVMERINESGAGVEAEMDPAGEIFTLSATNDRRAMEFDDQGTGLFDSLQIAEQRYLPEKTGVREDGMSRARAEDVADALEAVAVAVNAIFAEPVDGSAPATFLIRLRSRMHSAVAEAFGDDGDRFETDYGIDFDFSRPENGVFDFDSGARRDFIAAAMNDTAEMDAVLFGDARDDQDGLVGLFSALLDEYDATGSAGSLVDAYA